MSSSDSQRLQINIVDSSFRFCFSYLLPKLSKNIYFFLMFLWINWANLVGCFFYLIGCQQLGLLSWLHSFGNLAGVEVPRKLHSNVSCFAASPQILSCGWLGPPYGIVVSDQSEFLHCSLHFKGDSSSLIVSLPPELQPKFKGREVDSLSQWREWLVHTGREIIHGSYLGRIPATASRFTLNQHY